MGRVDRRWTEQAASSRKDSSNFEEGLVRIMFVAGALDHLTSFLAPHYAFVAETGEVTRRMCQRILHFLAVSVGYSANVEACMLCVASHHVS